MKRQWIAIGLAALGLVLFVFIVSTLANSDSIPVAQPNQEQEPNNSFNEANTLAVPGSVLGSLANSNVSNPANDTRDYYVFPTTLGQLYKANLSVVQNPGGLQLKMSIFNSSQAFVDDTFSSATGVSLQWTSNDSEYYLLVEAVGVTTSTLLTANYQLDVNPVAGSPTPTNTPLPGQDVYEPNDDITQPYTMPVAVSAIVSNANFFPSGDEDWYAYYAKQGRYYQASTSNLIGVDTRVEVFNPGGAKITGDNDGAGGFASRAEWQAAQTGWYYVRVTNLVASTATDRYDLTVSEIAAPPTETPTPVPAAPGQIDRCEDNSTLDRACTIAPNNAEQFNFTSPHGGPDNDFYRIWIKPGLLFTCRTSDLDPGVDPNMIVYDQNRNAIGGNDDVEQGNYNSAFSYYATYSGWLYLLVGYGNRTPPDIANSAYTLNCTTSQPSDATPTRQAGATPTPIRDPGPGAAATPVPVPTPEPVPELSVRVLSTPAPGVVATPAPRFVPITLLIYYDANDDRQPGAGEGIGGVSALVYDAATNQLLAQGASDDRGHLEFTVAAQGPVRVSIPFLGFGQLMAARGGSVYVRVAPAAGASRVS